MTTTRNEKEHTIKAITAAFYTDEQLDAMSRERLSAMYEDCRKRFIEVLNNINSAESPSDKATYERALDWLIDRYGNLMIHVEAQHYFDYHTDSLLASHGRNCRFCACRRLA